MSDAVVDVVFVRLLDVIFCVCCFVVIVVVVCRGVHRVTDLEKFPVRVSKDEAPTPLPLFGLVI